MSRTVRQITPDVQDIIQHTLRSLLGQGFVVALFGSEQPTGTMHYHLRIDHDATGLGIEHHDTIADGFIDDIFMLATRMKAMLKQRETLSRMSGGSQATGEVRLLTWMTEDTSQAVMQAAQKAGRECLNALRERRMVG
ncbi:hypothetical protein SAMN05444064_11257 [Pseudomonas syringae]|uniref:hypothetical protein n=1 Tax=Pseudomonas syringae TaxID=317 RepID=UPI000899ED07|nr:hypothetical protein [Pseudomonas syringae]SDX08271.1 hypothetical protein SAMN05444514_11157 [Pseudomonas syringae]SFM25917.1 hypothetical protein SAMN05444064_11257 [Pseudomonas syringae]